MMNDVLLLGGDTDTNACIVAGVIGTAQGLSNIDEAWITKVCVFDKTHEDKDKSGVPRPEFLLPGKHDMKALILKVLELAPLTLEISYE